MCSILTSHINLDHFHIENLKIGMWKEFRAGESRYCLRLWMLTKIKTRSIYLGAVDKGGSHLSLGEHGRCLDIVPVFTGERVHTENYNHWSDNLKELSTYQSSSWLRITGIEVCGFSVILKSRYTQALKLRIMNSIRWIHETHSVVRPTRVTDFNRKIFRQSQILVAISYIDQIDKLLKN